MSLTNLLQNIKDSIIFSNANLKAIANQKIRYEKELLDSQNEINSLLLIKSQRTNLLLALGVIFSTLLLGFIFYSRNHIGKLNNDLKRKNDLIEVNLKEKEELLKIQVKFNESETIRWKELDDYKNNLYGNITHEFRTPLTIILGMADQLMKNPKIQWRTRIEAIKRNGNQLLTLVNEMLELTKFNPVMPNQNIYKAM